MKRELKITYGTGLTINRSNYENEKPLYSQTTTVFLDDGETFDEKAEYQRLRALLDPMAEEHYRKAKLDLSGVRVRIKGKDKYPSVTSILNPLPFQLDEEYAIRGTEIHRLFNEFVKTGRWVAQAVPLKKLSFDEIKYKEFFENNKERIDFTDCEIDVEVFNDDHLYSGEVDIICLVDGKKTLADLKTGSWSWLQPCAYFKAIPDKGIEQLAIFDLKKQKLETIPLSNGKAKKAWEDFLVKRGVFQAIYNL